MWKVPKDVCAATVVSAIRIGYRHFDCACDYGNEVQVGEGIKQVTVQHFLQLSRIPSRPLLIMSGSLTFPRGCTELVGVRGISSVPLRVEMRCASARGDEVRISPNERDPDLKERRDVDLV